MSPDRVDAGDIGAHRGVDLDETALVDGHPGRGGVDRVAVGDTADGDEDAIEQLGALAGDLGLQAVLLGADALHAGAEQDVGVAALDPLRQGLDDVGHRRRGMSWSSISTTVTLVPSAS